MGEKDKYNNWNEEGLREGLWINPVCTSPKWSTMLYKNGKPILSEKSYKELNQVYIILTL